MELLHFRNLGRQELRFPREGAAIVGDNAQGKTNLLEAVYYLESFRSFRGSPDGDLPSFGSSLFRVQALVDGGQARSVSAAFDKSQKRKKVLIDGVEARPLSAGLGQLGAVVFSPADVELVSGGPAVRRRFLDIVLSLNEPGYVGALGRFRKALAQRNAALKRGDDRDSVRVWDPALAESGSAVSAHRRAWVADWQETFCGYYRAVSGGGAASLVYATRGRGSGVGECGVEDLLELLDRSWSSDVRLRTTTVGPHRDELRITIDEGAGEISARSHGSGGQRRSAALALRLVEAATIRASRDVEPLLLLDDAFAELDDGRTRRIMGLIEGEATGQVILTAPKEADVKAFRDRLPRWRIHDGVVEA